MSQVAIWFDCPKCGLPKSAPDGGYCGKCEDQYHREEHIQKETRIKEVEAALKKHSDDCDCHRCTMLCFELLVLKGKEREAYQLLNA